MFVRVIAASTARRGQKTSHVRRSLLGNREVSRFAGWRTGRSASGRRRAVAGDERTREVDSVIVAVKPANKAEHSAAEWAERRTGTEGNAGQQSTRRAQDRESVPQALSRVRKVAKERKKEKFTTLFHHLDVPMLRTAFFALKKDAAPGVDGVTWEAYEADLNSRIENLHSRLHRGAYRAQPARRRFIPKPDGRQRPLAVVALETRLCRGRRRRCWARSTRRSFSGSGWVRPKPPTRYA